jgi:hypothetical protein
VLSEVAPPPSGASWERRLRHVAAELRRVSLAHPHVFPLLATRVPASPQAVAPLEALLAALVAAGLDDARALRHFWAFIAWSTGALLAETAALTGAGAPSLDVPPDLDAAAFPVLARLGADVAACDFAEEYAGGLDILIDAVRAAAKDVGARPAPRPRAAPRRLRTR